MTTPSVSTAPPAERLPLRLLLAEHSGTGELDGGWWPQSRDLAVELADLVDHFPHPSVRVVRALYSRPDWEPAGRRVPIARGHLKVGTFPSDDTQVILLSTSDRRVLRVLVVPPGLTEDQGNEALLAAATPGNAHSARSLLRTVTETADVDPADHWTTEEP